MSNAAPADEVLARHRAEIRAGRDLAARLIAELDGATAGQDAIAAEIAAETADDKSPTRRNAMLKAVSLAGRAVTLRDLAQTLQRLIALERQAFAIDAKLPAAPEPRSREARLAEVNAEFDEIMRDDSEPAVVAADPPGGV